MKRLSTAAAVLLALCGMRPAQAAVIYESATTQSIGLAIVTEVSALQFLGARFHVAAPVRVTAVGGVFYGGGNTLFAAIVPLRGPAALPKGSPFSAPVTASITFDPGSPASDFLIPLPVNLHPGWYGLIFGAGQFGSPSGAIGGMLLDNRDVAGASYFNWNSSLNNGQWSDGGFSGARFIVEGQTRRVGNSTLAVNAPEPATWLLLGAALLGLALLRRRLA